MRCAQYQADNPAGNRFWEQCGTPLEARCSQCNTPVRPGTRFCGVCGHRLMEPETQGQPSVSQPPSTSLPAGTDYHSRLASYTPKYLVDKVFTTRSAMEGKPVTGSGNQANLPGRATSARNTEAAKPVVSD